MNRKLLDAWSVGGYLLMLGGLLMLFLNNALIVISVPVIAVQLLALALMFWARVTFRARSFHLTAQPTEGGLVTTGPYHYVRHPIYLSALLIAWGGVAGNLSMLTVLIGCVVTAGALIRIYCEETLVRVRYPEYEQYSEKTKRLIPYVY